MIKVPFCDELPNLFEVCVWGDSYYIVDLAAEEVRVSQRDGMYELYRDNVWDGYTSEKVAGFIKDGSWVITEILEHSGGLTEVGDLL